MTIKRKSTEPEIHIYKKVSDFSINLVNKINEKANKEICFNTFNYNIINFNSDKYDFRVELKFLNNDYSVLSQFNFEDFKYEDEEVVIIAFLKTGENITEEFLNNLKGE
jgi:aspartyl-tRNA synthetase